MTTNTTQPDQLVDELPAPVIPDGLDPLDDLTVGELGTVGRQLGCDPYAAVNDQATGLRWLALGHLAWVWAKRTDPRAKLDPILQLKPSQVAAMLRMLDDDDDDAAGDQDDVDQVDVAGELAENPTDSTPA